MEQQTLELGGRSWFMPEDRSIANDLWIEAEAKRAGLLKLEMQPGEDVEAFASRLLAETVVAGRVFPLLGGLLLPVGIEPSDWSETIAHETGRFLSRLTSAEDKNALRGIIAGMLARFFFSGLAYATTSESYSNEGATPDALSSPKPTEAV